jgi:hypothetical protein
MLDQQGSLLANTRIPLGRLGVQVSAWEQSQNVLKKEKHLEICDFRGGHYEDCGDNENHCGDFEDHCGDYEDYSGDYEDYRGD